MFLTVKENRINYIVIRNSESPNSSLLEESLSLLERKNILVPTDHSYHDTFWHISNNLR